MLYENSPSLNYMSSGEPYEGKLSRTVRERGITPRCYILVHIKYIELSEVAQEYTQNLPLGAIIGTLFLLEVLSSTLMPYHSILGSGEEIPARRALSYGLDESVLISSSEYQFWDSSFYSFSHIEGLGYTIYTYGLLWFILGSMILLLGMIGPIALTYDKSSSSP